MSSYRDYLLAERGLTPATVEGYVHLAWRFLASRWDGEELNLAGMSVADVLAFVLASCPGRATGSAKLIVTVTRSVLDWLHLNGIVEVSLASAVPSVAGWRLPGLPKALTPTQLQALLGSCDRRTQTGLRDYAIVVLLARLGLRSGEVARLGLDDTDWHAGELRVVGEGKPRREPAASRRRRRGDHGLPAPQASRLGRGTQRLRPGSTHHVGH